MRVTLACKQQVARCCQGSCPTHPTSGRDTRVASMRHGHRPPQTANSATDNSTYLYTHPLMDGSAHRTDLAGAHPLQPLLQLIHLLQAQQLLGPAAAPLDSITDVGQLGLATEGHHLHTTSAQQCPFPFPPTHIATSQAWRPAGRPATNSSTHLLLGAAACTVPPWLRGDMTQRPQQPAWRDAVMLCIVQGHASAARPAELLQVGLALVMCGLGNPHQTGADHRRLTTQQPPRAAKPHKTFPHRSLAQHLSLVTGAILIHSSSWAPTLLHSTNTETSAGATIHKLAWPRPCYTPWRLLSADPGPAAEVLQANYQHTALHPRFDACVCPVRYLACTLAMG